MYFLEEEFLDKDKKEQQNTVWSHDLPENQKYVCSYGSRLIIKSRVVISKFFAKSVKTSFHIPHC